MARLPSEAEIDKATEAIEVYYTALGKVAHSWNHMQEELNKLFCVVTGLDSSIGHAIWHALRSDLSQRDMLKEAIQARAANEEWVATFPRAEADILELLNAIKIFSEQRNAAIHAPCYVVPGEGEVEILAYSFSGNRNAKKLRGKAIIAEFDWYEQKANAFGLHARNLQAALSDAGCPWPDKLRIPTLGQARNS